MPKKDIHPTWYPESKVYCDGQLIMTVGSTREQLNVDIWSGNHPFYTGTQRLLDSEGRVERFMKNMEWKTGLPLLVPKNKFFKCY